VLKENDFDGEEALKAMGVGISAQLQDSIRATNSPPLAASTVARKGFNKPLIDTSHLINSIDYKVA
jgi:cobalamin biosynthesis Co2+ chelatase CbiK